MLLAGKGSALYKYWAAASADALLKLQRGERARMLGHLRKIYKAKGLSAGAIEEKLRNVPQPLEMPWQLGGFYSERGGEQ